MYKGFYKSPIGWLCIKSTDGGISNIDFVEHQDQPCHNDHIEQCLVQLHEYFDGSRKSFDITCDLVGSDFQKLVWSTLETIPYGQSTSYKNIAIAIQNPNASRAVGNANNKNPIPIIIPCHRVIGSNKKLVGYRGGLHIKEWLLDHERKNRNHSI